MNTNNTLSKTARVLFLSAICLTVVVMSFEYSVTEEEILVNNDLYSDIKLISDPPGNLLECKVDVGCSIPD